MMPSPSLEVAPRADVACSELLDGGILFDLNRKQYYSLNSTGLLVWRVLEAGGDLPAVAERLAARFPAAGGDDPFGLLRFVTALGATGLVAPKPAPSAPGASVAPDLPEVWSAPAIEAHGNPLAEVILSPFDPTVPIPE